MDVHVHYVCFVTDTGQEGKGPKLTSLEQDCLYQDNANELPFFMKPSPCALSLLVLR
jgi:hypothetical protein